MCIPGIETLLIGSLAPTAAVGSAAAIGGAGIGLGTIGTALQLGGSVVGAISQYQNSRAMAAAAERSASAANRRAYEATQSGEEESDLARRKGALLAARNKVSMAANGVDVTGAHAMELLEDTTSSANQDAFRIRTNAYRQAAGISQQAANFSADAASHSSASIFQPIQTLLGAGGRMMDRWSQYRAGQMYSGASASVIAGGYT